MPITPGTKLGQYEVVESIGAGGMGEVCQAHDKRQQAGRQESGKGAKCTGPR